MDFETFKMNPFSYYNPKISENYERDHLNENENETIYQVIEKKIKNKYKMLIPAIFMEIKSSKYFIEFSKEDLKNVNYYFNFPSFSKA